MTKGPKKAKAGAKKKSAGKKPASASEATAQMALPMPQDRDLKHYISEYQIAQARVKKEQQSLAKIVKAADEVGVSVDAIKRGLKIKDMNPLQAKSDLLQLAMVLNEIGSPVQFEVFEAKYSGAAAEAKVQGFRDGKAGRDRDYGAWIKGSPATRAYDEGYEAGMLENMPIDPKAKAALRVVPKEGEGAPLQH